MKRFFLLIILASLFLNASAQDLSLSKGWKFKTGDTTVWSAVLYDDSDWKPINVSMPWEWQGYAKYDGFGWYRLRIGIPMEMKEKAFIKDSVHFDMGYLDDGGEVYLNGKLIYKNWKTGDIKSGIYGPCSFNISANDPVILWDRANLIAVRVYDSAGNGGIYGDDFKLHMIDLMDNVTINTESDFIYTTENSLSKSIRLKASGGSYSFNGTLAFKVTDPETNTVIYEKIQPC